MSLTKNQIVEIITTGLAILFVVCLLVRLNIQQLPERNIVLSPHYDDAVLSLGGFIAHNNNKTIVATFFTQNASTTGETEWDRLSGLASSPESSTIRSRENSQSLMTLWVKGLDYAYIDFQYRQADQATSQLVTIHNSLVSSIEALIQENRLFKLNIFGPAYFGDDITHPDNKLLHQAFMEVAKLYVNDPNITFYIYEDFPYVKLYNQKNKNDLRSFIENTDKVVLVPTPLNISVSDVLLKEQALLDYVSQIRAFNALHKNIADESKQFTLARCATSACEMTYKIDFKIK